MKNEKIYQTFLAKQLLKNKSKIILEVPYKHKRIDIVQIDNKKIICIEVKIGNFSELLLQAAHHLIYSDFSYIAIPENHYNRKIYNKAKELSLGIILISINDYRIILTPEKNPYKIPKFYNFFRNYLLRCQLDEI